jgi:hypothetical protein
MFGIEFVDTATFKLNEAFNTNKGTWGLGLWERIRYSRTSVYMIVGVKIGYASRDQWRKYSHNINNHIDVGALYSTSARHVETAEIVEAMPIIFAYRLAKCHDLKMAHLRNPQSFVTGADLVELPTHTKFSMTDIAPKPLTEFLSKHSPANRPESRPHKPGTEDVLLGRLQSESPVSMSSKHSSLSSVATSDVDIDRQAPSRSTTWSSYGPKREDRNVRFSLQSMPEYPTTDYQDGAKVVRYDEAKPGETKSTEIRNDDDVVMQMALQFPTMAMTLLEKNYDTLISILRASSPENTFKILAGYDISPVGALIDDEDKDFFTGKTFIFIDLCLILQVREKQFG